MINAPESIWFGRGAGPTSISRNQTSARQRRGSSSKVYKAKTGTSQWPSHRIVEQAPTFAPPPSSAMFDMPNPESEIGNEARAKVPRNRLLMFDVQSSDPLWY
jgi:hypothetical protein